MALVPFLICADDPLSFQAGTVYAEDTVQAYELGAHLVRQWREKAREQGRVFAPRNGIRVMMKSGSMQAVRPGR